MAICRASRGSSQRGGGLSLLDGSVAGVASGLRVFCRLRHASDLCRRNSCTPPSIAQRPHAFARRVTGRRARRKLSRTAHGARATGRFDMRGSRLELAHAIDLSVHAFQRGGEHLLALLGLVSRRIAARGGGTHIRGRLAVAAAEIAIEMGEIAEAGFQGDCAHRSLREAGIAQHAMHNR